MLIMMPMLILLRCRYWVTVTDFDYKVDLTAYIFPYGYMQSIDRSGKNIMQILQVGSGANRACEEGLVTPVSEGHWLLLERRCAPFFFAVVPIQVPHVCCISSRTRSSPQSCPHSRPRRDPTAPSLRFIVPCRHLLPHSFTTTQPQLHAHVLQSPPYTSPYPPPESFLSFSSSLFPLGPLYSLARRQHACLCSPHPPSRFLA